MRKFLLLICVSFLSISLVYAQPSGKGFVMMTEEDGSPECFGYQIKVANSNLTDNADGTCSVSSGGSSEWTDTGSIVHPNEETVDEIAIGGTTEAGADIFLGVDGSAVLNEQGNSVDVRIEGNTDANLLFTDGSADKVGIGNNSPGEKLDTTGNTQTSGQFIEGTGTTTDGVFGLTQITKTSNFILTNSESVYLCDASSGAIVATLPPVSGTNNRIYHVKKTDSSSNTCTIDGDGSETVDGATTAVMIVQYEAITIISNNSAWFIL